MEIVFGLCMSLGCGGMFLMLAAIGIRAVNKAFNDTELASSSTKIALWGFIISIVWFAVAYFVWRNLNKL